MSRLIRMDRTGHSTLAEWTRRRPGGRRGRRRGLPPRAGPRLPRHGHHRPGPGRAGPRAAAWTPTRSSCAARSPAAERWRPIPRSSPRPRPSTGGRASTRAPAPPRAAVDAHDGRARPPVRPGRRGRSSGSSRWRRRSRSCASRTPGSSRSSTRRAARTSCAGPSGPRRRGPSAPRSGLLGDLVGHEARDLHARTGSSSSPAASGRGWSARRARCSCGRAGAACTASASASPDRELPSADRIAHLLLALRSRRAGLRHVANHGVLRRARAGAAPASRGQMRPALDAACGRGPTNGPGLSSDLLPPGPYPGWVRTGTLPCHDRLLRGLDSCFSRRRRGRPPRANAGPQRREDPPLPPGARPPAGAAHAAARRGHRGHAPAPCTR